MEKETLPTLDTFKNGFSLIGQSNIDKYAEIYGKERGNLMFRDFSDSVATSIWKDYVREVIKHVIAQHNTTIFHYTEPQIRAIVAPLPDEMRKGEKGCLFTIKVGDELYDDRGRKCILKEINIVPNGVMNPELIALLYVQFEDGHFMSAEANHFKPLPDYEYVEFYSGVRLFELTRIFQVSKI